MKQFKNDLTIHLYRRDEALASMRWGILNHSLLETIFWGLELYDSDYQEDALEMLEFIWISSIGFGSWSAIKSVFEIYESGELDRNTWISILLAWARIQTHDSTIFKLVHRRSEDIKSLNLEKLLLDYKLLESWIIGSALPPYEQWEILDRIAKKNNRSKELLAIKNISNLEIQNLAAAYALVTLSDVEWNDTNSPLNRSVSDEIKKTIVEWDSLGLRARRIYKVKPEAMLYLCSRSLQSVYESNESDLQENLEITLKASSFWKGILLNYMDSNYIWKSDRSKEEFYDTYFIDDIPDEWSQKDREQSHGRGTGKSNEEASKKFINTLFQKSISRITDDSIMSSITVGCLN